MKEFRIWSCAFPDCPNNALGDDRYCSGHAYQSTQFKKKSKKPKRESVLVYGINMELPLNEPIVFVRSKAGRIGYKKVTSLT